MVIFYNFYYRAIGFNCTATWEILVKITSRTTGNFNESVRRRKCIVVVLILLCLFYDRSLFNRENSVSSILFLLQASQYINQVSATYSTHIEFIHGQTAAIFLLLDFDTQPSFIDKVLQLQSSGKKSNKTQLLGICCFLTIFCVFGNLFYISWYNSEVVVLLTV